MVFYKSSIDTHPDLFNQISQQISFEPIIPNARYGAILVKPNNHLIPIVRTTTKYNNPVQKIDPINELIDLIKQEIYSNNLLNHNIEFNNAMVELYNSNYKSMGFHSDQALDLADNSFICIFSLYSNPSSKNIRQLIIKQKNKTVSNTILNTDTVSDTTTQIDLTHNSFVLFDLKTNQSHLHKIILKPQSSIPISIDPTNQWLGITLRLSKTYIDYNNAEPTFYPSGNILKLANETETREFYKKRSNENSSDTYTYEPINYTLSLSDLIKPLIGL